MFCRQYIKKIFSLVSVVNHSNFFFPKIFFMRVLFRFPKFPYTFDFQVLFLESQKSVKGNRASSLSSNRSKSAFCKAFFRKLFFFLIKFCSASERIATSGISSSGCAIVKCFFMSNRQTAALHEGHSSGWFIKGWEHSMVFSFFAFSVLPAKQHASGNFIFFHFRAQSWA